MEQEKCSMCNKIINNENNSTISSNIVFEEDINIKSLKLVNKSLKDNIECDKNSVISESNLYGQTEITNSKNVIIGNVTYITGPVHISEEKENVQEESITNKLYKNMHTNEDINIIFRENWMAQSAREITQLPTVAQYVIIAHTASEEGYTQAQNTLLVKLIQTFHIESRGWDDIGYNFLIGCDGNVYEGRGWNIQGAHTYGYNNKSVCIAFIGCFMDHLPTISALNAAKYLVNKGVRLGYISEFYTLAGHCQCSPIESPGFQLYNEIKTWPKWRELTPEDCKL